MASSLLDRAETHSERLMRYAIQGLSTNNPKRTVDAGRKMSLQDNDGNDHWDGEKCTYGTPHPRPEGNRQKDEERI